MDAPTSSARITRHSEVKVRVWISSDKRVCVYQLNSTSLVSAVLFYMTRKLRGVRSRLRKRCLTVLDRHVISVQLPWDSNGVEIPK